MCISDWSSDVCSSDLATWSRTELRKLPLHERRKDPFMETIGLGCYFEDLPVGRKFKTIGRTVTDADITNFVNATGMVEVLFTNIEFLREESDIKGRVAPGALAYCFAEGLLVQSTMQHTGFAFLGDRKSTRLNSSH